MVLTFNFFFLKHLKKNIKFAFEMLHIILLILESRRANLKYSAASSPQLLARVAPFSNLFRGGRLASISMTLHHSLAPVGGVRDEKILTIIEVARLD